MATTVQEFNKHLRKGYGPGAKWHKADFHVHMPGQDDYEYKSADAIEKLGTTLRDNNYSVAFLIKHQEFPTRAELDALQKHCPQTALIPAAELNVFVDALSKRVGKDYFFHCILAVHPDHPGGYTYPLTAAQHELTYKTGEYPAGFRSSIIDLGKYFRDKGALFIPAHLHQKNKPETSRSVDVIYDDDAFLGFIREGAFDALEVTSPSTADFFTGGKKTKEGQEIPHIVCVSSSDAHHYEHIPTRNRATWLQLETPSFAQVKAALTLPHRVSLSSPQAAHPRVVGLHIVGSFLPEMWLHFNHGLNAFIGSKGSGKTAILECLRFVLNTGVPAERQESVARHLAHVLGSAGFVECLVDNGSSQSVISRRADSPTRISIIDAAGQSRTVTSSDGVVFPIAILGWHEIEAVADKASARITLLDRIGDAGTVKTQYDQIRAAVESARDNLPVLQRAVKGLWKAHGKLLDLRAKRKTLEKLAQSELSTLQEQYEWYLSTEQSLDGLRIAVSKRQSTLNDSVLSNLSLDTGTLTGDASEALGDCLNAISVALQSNQSLENSSCQLLAQSLSAIASAADSATASAAESFACFRETVYTPKVSQLEPHEREVLSRQIQVLEETKSLPTFEKHCTQLLDDVKAHALWLKDMCTTVTDIRESIKKARQHVANAFNQDMSTVQLRFLPSTNHERREAFAQQHPTFAPEVFSYLGAYSSEGNYMALERLFTSLLNLTLDEPSWKIGDLIWDTQFVDILDVFDDDDVEISLQVGKAGLVPIQNLSAGQRSVAVFPLLLRNNRGPLVIDQPEDNLDNRYIADVIAKDLLRRKKEQQFMVTSHNANLVVLTDADLVVHVDSDGATCHIDTSGFLACSTSSVRKAVLDVLDGGEEALASRQLKYGTSS